MDTGVLQPPVSKGEIKEGIYMSMIKQTPISKKTPNNTNSVFFGTPPTHTHTQSHSLGFYSDYVHVLKRYATLFMRRFVICWPIRPLALLYIPSTIASLVLAWRAFTSKPEEDDD